MTNAYDKLRAMKACASALRWIGDRTIEQAWHECDHGGWMCWLLERITPGDPRLRLAAADMAERVWDLITDEPTRLAAAWAIDAARRGDEDEMLAASDAAAAAAYAATSATADAADAAAFTADALAGASLAAAYADDATTYEAEHTAQADILRQYFSAREVGDLFRRTPA